MAAVTSPAELSRRNFVLGLINGALFIFLMAFIDTDTVITGFAWQLTGGKAIWIGLLVSVINTGWFWPALLLSPVLATTWRLLPAYRVSVVTRLVGLFAMAAVAWYVDRFSVAMGFALFALTFLTYTVGGGISLIPFMSIVSDTIPAQWRGRFFGARYLIGGLLAFGAGFLVKSLLSEQGAYRFPHNYAILFGLAAILAVPSLIAFCFVEECPRSVQRRRLPLMVELRRGLRILKRDRNFRRLVVTRSVATVMLGLSLPFIVPYALSQLGSPAAAVGLFMSCKVLTYAISNVFWSRVSDNRGNRRLLLLSSFMGLAAVWMLLGVRLLPEGHLLSVAGLALSWRVAFVCVIFAAFGFSNAGQEIGYTNFLLELIPERKRPTYLSVFYLVWLPLCWVPFFGALLIGNAHRFTLGFTLAALLSLLLVRFTLRLREVRELEVSAAQTSAWRRAKAWVNGK